MPLCTVHDRNAQGLPWDLRLESPGSDKDITEQFQQKVMLKITFK